MFQDFCFTNELEVKYHTAAATTKQVLDLLVVKGPSRPTISNPTTTIDFSVSFRGQCNTNEKHNNHKWLPSQNSNTYSPYAILFILVGTNNTINYERTRTRNIECSGMDDPPTKQGRSNGPAATPQQQQPSATTTIHNNPGSGSFWPFSSGRGSTRRTTSWWWWWPTPLSTLRSTWWWWLR